MNEYRFKSIFDYNKIKQLYNVEPLTVIWHDEGAPSTKIGKCVECYKKWFSTIMESIHNGISYEDFEDFGKYYFKNCKSYEEIVKLAEHLQTLFAEHENEFLDKKDEILNLDNIIDLIILHAVVETFLGAIIEYRVAKHIREKGRKVIKDENLDRYYGIDLLVESKNKGKFVGIQVKPISFFIGKKQDLIKDREKVFEQFNKLQVKRPNIEQLFFVIYRKESNGEMKFLDKNNNIFHEFLNLEDMMNHEWYDICKDDSQWKNI